MAITADTIDKLREIASRELAQANSRDSVSDVHQSNSGDYKLVYPFQDGQLKFRLLFNAKSGIIQRRIVRHSMGDKNVPCMQLYGEDCPICAVVNDVENARDKGCGVRRDAGYKVRGICYAQLIDFPQNYFDSKKEADRPRKGEIVLLMYPKTVYDKINEVINNSGEHLSDLIMNNEGRAIILSKKKGNNGFPEYDVSVDPYGTVKTFTAPKEGHTNVEDTFQDMYNNLPNLTDVLMPRNPTEEMRTQARAASQSIMQKYLGSKIVNPNEKPLNYNPPQSHQNLGETDLPFNSGCIERSASITPEKGNIAQTSDVPFCYGQHDGKQNKCILCPAEIECIGATAK